MSEGESDVGAEALASALARLAATGEGELRALVGEFRRSTVLVPLAGDDALLSLPGVGIRWLPAFTGEAALTRFAEARGERLPAYLSLYGARLLDRVVPRVGEPTGIAVDAGGPHGMVLPPVRGVVPDAAALDVGPGVEYEPDVRGAPYGKGEDG